RLHGNCQESSGRWLFGDREADASHLGDRLPCRLVMQIEPEIAVGGNQLGGAVGAEVLRRDTGHVDASNPSTKHVPEDGFTRGADPSIAVERLAGFRHALGISLLLIPEELVGRNVRGMGFDIRHSMMKGLAVTWSNLD